MQLKSNKTPRKIQQTCVQCGASFYAVQYQIDHGRAKNCSKKCADQSRATPVEDRLRVLIDQSGGPDACWPWVGAPTKRGYARIAVKKNGKKTYRGAHVIAYELANGPVPPGYHVCHRCDNPPCCNPAHLFTGTPSDNINDAIKKNRRAYQKPEWERTKKRLGRSGERNVGAKLTGAQVAEIRALDAIDRRAAMARAFDYGIKRSMFYMIVSHRAWNHG